MKIKQIAIFLIAVLILSTLPVCAENTAANVWKEFYVSVNGNDANDGTKEAPFATIERAQEAVREVSEGMQGDIVVNIAGGTYYLDNEIWFFPEDSGKNGYQVIYRGEEGNMPIISGGRDVGKFSPSTSHPGLYEMKLSYDEILEGLYVNGQRRYMARGNRFMYGVTKPEKYDNDQWYREHPNDIKDDHYNWYDPETPYRWDGFYMSKEDIGLYENQKDISFMWNKGWKTYYVPVEEIMQDPDNRDQVIVRMKPGLWESQQVSNQTMGNNPKPTMEFVIVNAMEVLDDPGEFYYNRKTQTLYYMPYEYENMETAEIIVPEQEHLIFLDGHGIENKVKNITFEGLQFSHTTWNYMEDLESLQGSNIEAAPGHMITWGYSYATGNSGMPLSAVTGWMLDNVNFLNNHFYGTCGGALDLPTGVTNSRIVGNTFADIGEYAINIASSIHDERQMRKGYAAGNGTITMPPPEDAGELVINKLLYHKFDASYDAHTTYDVKRNASRRQSMKTLVGMNYDTLQVPFTGDQHETWLGEYRYGRAWKGDPDAAEKGIKTWVMWDFLRPWDISKITLAFDPEDITDAEKSGFEVLVSNDKSFAEGTYEVVATQTTPAAEVQEYTVDLEGKYQYLMVRTLGATPFAISRMWAFSPEYKPYTKYERCKNVYIENNYFNRIGVDVPRATTIMLHYAEDIKIRHNHIENTGYTGIAFSWGWNSIVVGNYDLDISYNYLHNTTSFLTDGAPIYSVGPAPGTIMQGNYFDGARLTNRSYYTDSGSHAITYINNVHENVSEIISPYNSAIHGVKFDNMYAAHEGKYIYDAAYERNDIGDFIFHVPGQPKKEAYAIIENAGIEPQYEYIKDRIDPDIDYIYYDEIYMLGELNSYGAARTDTRNTAMIKEAEAMINTDAFGVSLGQFPIHYKFELEDLVKEFKEVGTSDRRKMLRKLMELETFTREVKESVQRYSLEDSIELCKKALADAKPMTKTDKSFGLYKQEAIDTFKAQVEKLEAQAKNVKTYEEEYDVLMAIEAAYNEFMSNKLTAEIATVFTRGIRECNIDSDSATVELVLDASANIKDLNLSISTESGGKLAEIVKKSYNMEQGLKLPVFCKANGKYKIWNITAKYEEGNTEAKSLVDADWYAKPEKKIVKEAHGGTVISGSTHVVMSDYKPEEGETVGFKFVPMTYNDVNDFTFILAAKSFEKLDRSKTEAVHDRLEIVFENRVANLYSIKNGKKTLIAKVNTPIRYNEENTFSYSFKKLNNSTHIEVKLNGKTIFNELANPMVEGSFFGIYSEAVSFKLY